MRTFDMMCVDNGTAQVQSPNRDDSAPQTLLTLETRAFCDTQKHCTYWPRQNLSAVLFICCDEVWPAQDLTLQQAARQRYRDMHGAAGRGEISSS